MGKLRTVLPRGGRATGDWPPSDAHEEHTYEAEEPVRAEANERQRELEALRQLNERQREALLQVGESNGRVACLITERRHHKQPPPLGTWSSGGAHPQLEVPTTVALHQLSSNPLFKLRNYAQ